MLAYTIKIWTSDTTYLLETAHDMSVAIAFILENTNLEYNFVAERLERAIDYPQSDPYATSSNTFDLSGDMLVSVNIGSVPDKTLPKIQPGIDIVVRTHAKMEIQKLIKHATVAFSSQEPMKISNINYIVATVAQTIDMNRYLLEATSVAAAMATAAVSIGSKFPVLKDTDYQGALVALSLFLEAIERLV